MSPPRRRIALITNCTSSANFEPVIDISSAPEVQTMADLCDWWITEMRRHQKDDPNKMVTPGALYNGHSINVVTEMAQTIGHDNVFVVNRGAGLVRFTEKMLPYNFTYGKGDKSGALYKVKGEKFMPSLWWGMVNEALYGEPNPLSKITTIDGKPYDIIITSLNSSFIRLVSADLSLIQDSLNRLFIPIPRSNCSAIPRNIRGSCIPFTKAYTQDLVYSRYNKMHTVTQKILNTGMAQDNFIFHVTALRDAQDALDDIKTADAVPLEKLFEEHPDLIKCASAEVALNRARMKGLRVGSHTAFVGAWRGARGTQQLDIGKSDLKSATSSLKSIMNSMEAGELFDNEEILDQIGLFIAAVKVLNPGIMFTSKDVAAWGHIQYSIPLKKKNTIASSSKVASMLRTHVQYLGLELIELTGAVAYKIRQESNHE